MTLTADQIAELQDGWDRSCVHIPGRPSEGSPLGTLAAFGTLLGSPLLRLPVVRVALDGKRVGAHEFTGRRRVGTEWVDDAVARDAVVRLLARGATVTVDELEHFLPSVHDITEQLTSAFGMPFRATAYVTASGVRGLREHTDEEEVVVVQTFGTKTWHVSDEHRRTPAHSGPFIGPAPLADIGREVVLSPGDVLLVPSGTPHVTRTELGLSIHITFSAERTRVRTAAMDLLTTVAAALDGGDGFLRADDDTVGVQSFIAALLTATGTGISRVDDSPMAGDAVLQSWDALTAQSVSLRRGAVFSTCLDESSTRIRHATGQVRIGNELAPTLIAIERGTTVTIDGDALTASRAALYGLVGLGLIAATPAEPEA